MFDFRVHKNDRTKRWLWKIYFDDHLLAQCDIGGCKTAREAWLEMAILTGYSLWTVRRQGVYEEE